MDVLAHGTSRAYVCAVLQEGRADGDEPCQCLCLSSSLFSCSLSGKSWLAASSSSVRASAHERLWLDRPALDTMQPSSTRAQRGAKAS